MILMTKFGLIVYHNPINIITIIPIVISAISLIVSLLLALRTWWIERFKLDFEIIKWFGCNGAGYPIFLWLYITNYSKLPCSVLEIKISNERNGQIVEGFGTGNKKLITIRNSTGMEPEYNYSLDYPVKIEPYSSIGGYFHIVSKSAFYEYEDHIVRITVRTSRGTITKNVFMDYGKNIFRVRQHRDPSVDVKIDKRADGSVINYLEDSDLN